MFARARLGRKWSIAGVAQSSLSMFDIVQNHLSGLVGDELFSTVQPLSPQTKHQNPVGTLPRYQY